MNFLNRMKGLHKTAQQLLSPEREPLVSDNQDQVAMLWYSLEENPNQEDKIQQLLLICQKKGGLEVGKTAMYELAKIEKSFLPQLYLGKIALEEKDEAQAWKWYQTAISVDLPEDTALDMVASDLLVFRMAEMLVALIAPVYSVRNHSPGIGLCLLNAYCVTENVLAGYDLLVQLRELGFAEIKENLDDFSKQLKEIELHSSSHRNVEDVVEENKTVAPAKKNNTSKIDLKSMVKNAISGGSKPAIEVTAEPTVELLAELSIEASTDETKNNDTADQAVSELVEGKAKKTAVKETESTEKSLEEISSSPSLPSSSAPDVSAKQSEPDLRFSSFLTSMENPPWVQNFPGVESLLPIREGKKRVGIYMYANTTSNSNQGNIPLENISSKDLSLGLPLYLSEKLLFESNFSPILLFPVSYEYGPQGSDIDPDIQALYTLCSREKLDFLIAGTINQREANYSIRTWILDRVNKNAKIISKDLPFVRFGYYFQSMVEEITRVFNGGDPDIWKSNKDDFFAYRSPVPEIIQASLVSKCYLLQQHLVRKSFCSAGILKSDKAMLDLYVTLTAADVNNQVFFMTLLSGMKNLQEMGSPVYEAYRSHLYQVADKNRQVPCVKRSAEELNSLFLN